MEALIEQLGIPHRALAAYHSLRGMGFAVVPVARQGLQHENAEVRYYCVRLLDFFLVPDALTDLLNLLHDPDPRVRGAVLHTLACNRCKAGDCRPAEADVLPDALQQLRDDEDRHVRALAVEVVGQFVHHNPEAESALVEASVRDPSPTVRKKAGWFAPGGSIYNRTAPRPPRKARPACSPPAGSS